MLGCMCVRVSVCARVARDCCGVCVVSSRCTCSHDACTALCVCYATWRVCKYMWVRLGVCVCMCASVHVCMRACVHVCSKLSICVEDVTV